MASELLTLGASVDLGQGCFPSFRNGLRGALQTKLSLLAHHDGSSVFLTDVQPSSSSSESESTLCCDWSQAFSVSRFAWCDAVKATGREDMTQTYLCVAAAHKTKPSTTVLFIYTVTLLDRGKRRVFASLAATKYLPDILSLRGVQWCQSVGNSLGVLCLYGKHGLQCLTPVPAVDGSISLDCPVSLSQAPPGVSSTPVSLRPARAEVPLNVQHCVWDRRENDGGAVMTCLVLHEDGVFGLQWQCPPSQLAVWSRYKIIDSNLSGFAGCSFISYDEPGCIVGLRLADLPISTGLSRIPVIPVEPEQPATGRDITKLKMSFSLSVAAESAQGSLFDRIVTDARERRSPPAHPLMQPLVTELGADTAPAIAPLCLSTQPVLDSLFNISSTPTSALELDSTKSTTQTELHFISASKDGDLTRASAVCQEASGAGLCDAWWEHGRGVAVVASTTVPVIQLFLVTRERPDIQELCAHRLPANVRVRGVSVRAAEGFRNVTLHVLVVRKRPSAAVFGGVVAGDASLLTFHLDTQTEAKSYSPTVEVRATSGVATESSGDTRGTTEETAVVTGQWSKRFDKLEDMMARLGDLVMERMDRLEQRLSTLETHTKRQ